MYEIGLDEVSDNLDTTHWYEEWYTWFVLSLMGFVCVILWCVPNL